MTSSFLRIVLVSSVEIPEVLRQNQRVRLRGCGGGGGGGGVGGAILSHHHHPPSSSTQHMKLDHQTGQLHIVVIHAKSLLEVLKSQIYFVNLFEV